MASGVGGQKSKPKSGLRSVDISSLAAECLKGAYLTGLGQMVTHISLRCSAWTGCHLATSGDFPLLKPNIRSQIRASRLMHQDHAIAWPKMNVISASDDALTYPSPCWTIKNASKHWPWACHAATATPQLRNSLKGLFQPDSEIKQGRFCHSSILSLVPFHAHQGDGSDLFTASPLEGQRRRRVPWGLRRRRGRCCFAPLRRSLVRHEDANKRQVELVEEDHNSLISP